MTLRNIFFNGFLAGGGGEVTLLSPAGIGLSGIAAGVHCFVLC